MREENYLKVRNISIYILMLFWLFMPIVMSCYDFIMGMTGSFTPQKEISDSWVYIKAIICNRVIFVSFGIITIGFLFVLLIFLHGKNFYIKSEKASYWFFLFSILLLWAVMSTALSDNPIEQFIGSEVICDGLFTYFVYAAMFVIGCIFTKERERRKIILFFTVIITYLSAIMLLQETRNSFIVYCFPTIKSSVFQNSNYFGYMLCISVIALLGLYLYDDSVNKHFNIIYGILYTLQLFTLLINKTFGSYLAVLVSLPICYLFYYWSGRRWKREIWIPIIIFTVLSVWYFAFYSSDFQILMGDVNDIIIDPEAAGYAGSGRWALWMDSIERIKVRPIFGWGPEGFNEQGTFATMGSPHNDVFQIAGYLGIPAVIIYYGAFLTLENHLYKHIKELSISTLIASGMVVCYLISALFGHPVYNTTPYFWLFLGMITVMNEQDTTCLQIVSIENDMEKKKIRTTVFAILFFLVFCFGIAAYRQSHGAEKTRENADLLAMYNAELTTQLRIRSGTIEEGEYWYDVNDFALLPVTKDAPEAYGEGTRNTGDGTKEFEEKYEISYQYDEAEDYTDKVIKVIVNPDTEEIIVKWVTP